LLTIVVDYEMPELEQQRVRLIEEDSMNKASLQEQKDMILQELSQESGNLLEN